MKTARLNLSKLDKSAIYEGQKGKYVDLVIFDHRDGPDEWGNDGFIAQDIGKERRLAGERGPIIGNWKEFRGGGKPNQSGDQNRENDDSPF